MENRVSHLARALTLGAAVSMTLAACGGGNSAAPAITAPASNPPAQQPSSYTISGTISGLPGYEPLILQDGNGNRQTLLANGAFSFTEAVNANYTLAVQTNPLQAACTVTNGSGMAKADVTSVVIACTPASPVLTPVTGFSEANGVAVDAAGNLYIAAGSQVDIVPKGSTTATGATQITGFNLAVGVAVDANGVIYVTDSGNAQLDIVPKGATSLTGAVQITGFGGVGGVAVDASGNIYVTDTVNGQIDILPEGATSLSQAVQITGLSTNTIVTGAGPIPYQGPTGIAVDVSGNIYVADAADAQVYVIPKGATSLTTATRITGFNTPMGVAVDASGNIYVADFGANQVDIVPKGTTAPALLASTAHITGYFTFSAPLGIDTNGNLYVSNGTNQVIQEISPVAP
jgi:sugar lactone lactonase YvrE